MMHKTNEEEECEEVLVFPARILPMLPCALLLLTPPRACFRAKSRARGTERSNPESLSVAQLTYDPKHQTLQTL